MRFLKMDFQMVDIVKYNVFLKREMNVFYFSIRHLVYIGSQLSLPGFGMFAHGYKDFKDILH